MGKIVRRGTAAGALALAGALAFSTAAAAQHDGAPIDIDDDPQDVSISGGPIQYRFADADRVGTALQAYERTDLPWGNTAIIATADDFADALAATPLADMLDAPVFLNNSGNELRADVLEAAGEFEEVILVGGTDVFGMGIVEQLDDAVDDVNRIEGANRYQTAIQLAEAAVQEGIGGEPNGAPTHVNVFLADGTNFPDALAAGAAAADNSGVVLLTNGSDRIDRETYDYLSTGSLQRHESIIAIGGPAAAAGAAAGHQGDPIETNFDVVGDDRYETAVATAEQFVDGVSDIVITSGENFPDAVVGGAYAANVDGPLLLTRQGGLSDVTGDYLEDNRLDVERLYVFGGRVSVSPRVSGQIATLDWRY